MLPVTFNMWLRIFQGAWAAWALTDGHARSCAIVVSEVIVVVFCIHVLHGLRVPSVALAFLCMFF